MAPAIPFASGREVESLLDGPIGERLLDRLPEKGLVGLACRENGFFNATNSERTIVKIEDFQGLECRTIQAKISQEAVRVHGLVAHAAATRELQAGTIIGPDTVSNRQGGLHGSSIRNGGVGYCCLAELRMYETIETGAAQAL